MTPSQILLVETSFEAFIPVAHTTTKEFYDDLFQIAPHLRHMFPVDMGEQRLKLITTLNHAVKSLRLPDSLLPILHKMGERHKGYHAKPEHYAVVAETLLNALARALGPDFTPDVRDAWAACIAFIAAEMQRAAATPRGDLRH